MQKVEGLTNGEEDLEFGVLFFHGYDPFVKSFLPVLAVIVAFEGGQFALLQPAEGEDDVSAQMRIQIFRQELTQLLPVLGPVRVVANVFHVFIGRRRRLLVGRDGRRFGRGRNGGSPSREERTTCPFHDGIGGSPLRSHYALGWCWNNIFVSRLSPLIIRRQFYPITPPLQNVFYICTEKENNFSAAK